MEKRLPPSSRIHKTTILFVIALAVLRAVGVTATMISTATTAHAAICRDLNTPVGKATICPTQPPFEVCPPDHHCIGVGPKS